MPYVRNEYPRETKTVSQWKRFGIRLGASIALHPLEYSKILMQLGYEPIPAVPGRSILGKPIMLFPNIFQYAGHIRKMDGFYGCYRGLVPRIVGSVFSMALSEKIADSMGLRALEEHKDEDMMTDEELYIKFKFNLKRDVVLTVSGIVVAQPFHVITIRMMAQFIGGEQLYTSISGSIAEIFRTEGIIGFFAGLVPKLLCDVACVVFSSSTIYLLNKYFLTDKNARQYSAGFMQYAYSSILYPLNVVSTCMAVSGSNLIAGQPPIMPTYNNWLDCFNDLHARHELKRGSSVFWRSAGGFAKPMLRNSGGYVPLSTLAKYK